MHAKQIAREARMRRAEIREEAIQAEAAECPSLRESMLFWSLGRIYSAITNAKMAGATGVRVAVHPKDDRGRVVRHLQADYFEVEVHADNPADAMMQALSGRTTPQRGGAYCISWGDGAREKNAPSSEPQATNGHVSAASAFSEADDHEIA
jgi:hypothetical protein